MSNVTDIRGRLADIKQNTALGRYVRSFLSETRRPDQQALARDRAALELRGWAERTAAAHGEAVTIAMLEYRIERMRAARDGGA